ncbi:MAG: class I SAM-dependent methyltransferase [bacterium]
MPTKRQLPAEFIRRLNELEESYLATDDPIRQSGFGGGPKRWRAEREPILDAVTTDGDLLDIGCANGYLLQCLTAWGRERGVTLTPYGLDFSSKLIELARRRLSEYAANFYVGNAWDWQPPRRFKYVYTVYDCVLEEYLEEYVHRLLTRVVDKDGRLIIGAYGSRSQKQAPFDIAGFLKSYDFIVAGTAQDAIPPTSVFTWVDNR